MNKFLRTLALLVTFVAVPAIAHAKHRYHNHHDLSPAQCLANVLAGESDGTEESMRPIAGVVFRRVQMGMGDICTVAYARKQFIGVKHAYEKSRATRALALRIAKKLMVKSKPGKYWQFRTVGYARCGTTIGGNTFFNSCGNTRYASHRSTYSRNRYAASKARMQQLAYLFDPSAPAATRNYSTQGVDAAD